MPTRRVRFSVTRKIALGLTLIIAIGMVSILFIYRGLDDVEQALQRLAEVQAPLNAAAYEMELNVNGMGLAVLKYLATRRPEYRTWAQKDERDFAQYHATYLRLVRTERERGLARRIGRLHEEFSTLGEALMSQAVRQEKGYTAIADHIEELDYIIDARLQPALFTQVSGRRDSSGAAVATADLEAEAAEVGFWVANYHRAPSPQAKETIANKLAVLERTLANFRGFPLSQSQARDARDLHNTITRIGAAIDDVLSLEDEIHGGRQRFIELRASIDNVLDDEIQVLALRGLDVPRQQATAAADAVLRAMHYLIPLYLLTAGIIGVMLVYVIRVPVTQLTRGTKAITEGDLTYRMKPTANDEFGDLANQYNRMVAQLEETTVSRDRLRHEIVERERAEREREKLQAELGRNETMTAMGALVAGVAHEVRNPLFGISSTLDAMEARLGEHVDHQRYLAVLRTEVNRLSGLMEDLLSYGKPSTRELTVGPVKAVVARAAEACRALASEVDATIVNRAEHETALIRLDEGRLVQALQNVLDNALQHAPPRTAVTIAAKQMRENGRRWVECVVTDCGPGFHPDDLPRIFDPFFTRRRGGTGLGLALVQRIVHEHGGEVSGANRPEGGAAVTLRLPLAQ